MRPYDADVAIVATKAYDTEGAIETLRKAIAYPEKCVFVSPQNGVGNEERLAAAFGADNVVAAALTTPIDRDRDGNARAAKEGGLALAPVGANAYNWLSATFAGTGLSVKVVEDWRALKWSKLALNVVANASCAILNVLPNRFVHFDKIFTLEIRMIREVRAVMQALHVDPIDLPRYPVRALFARRRASEPALADAAGAQHRRRARHEAAVAAARFAPRKTADGGRRAQRSGRRRRPRARACRLRSMRSTRACSTTSRTRRRSGRSIASTPTGWRPKSKPR